MNRAKTLQSHARLQSQIRELAQKVGPDHARVARLKADLAIQVGSPPPAPFPGRSMSPIDLNAVTAIARAELGGKQQAEAADQLAKHQEMARFLAEIDAIVVKTAKRDAW